MRAAESDNDKLIGRVYETAAEPHQKSEKSKKNVRQMKMLIPKLHA